MSGGGEGVFAPQRPGPMGMGVGGAVLTQPVGTRRGVRSPRGHGRAPPRFGGSPFPRPGPFRGAHPP